MVEHEILYCDDAAAWTAWLTSNHETSAGVRLAIAKKGSAHTSVTNKEALDGALCHGWIDGKRTRMDDDYYLQVYCPRRPQSLWSQINRDNVARLIEEGRMQAAGFREIERAKADGRWDAAYASQKNIQVPDDLAAALAASPQASDFFGRLSSQNRFAILFRIGNVKRAETRARKITEFVAMLERGETIYPQPPSKA